MAWSVEGMVRRPCAWSRVRERVRGRRVRERVRGRRVREGIGQVVQGLGGPWEDLSFYLP